MKYLLSIVIPTKNRYSTLFPLVDQLVNFVSRYSDIEVVIQDNSDDNSEALEFFSNLSYNNLIYNYTKGWLSVVENCDKAIMLSKGDFVTLIGDDDAVSEEIIKKSGN